jgi:hypothetical protein
MSDIFAQRLIFIETIISLTLLFYSHYTHEKIRWNHFLKKIFFYYSKSSVILYCPTLSVKLFAGKSFEVC